MSTVFILFTGGLLAFFSPCIVHMLPLYLMYMTGSAGSKRKAVTDALAFFIGLVLVFACLGAVASSVSSLFESRYWQLIGGALIVLFGVRFLWIRKRDCGCEGCREEHAHHSHGEEGHPSAHEHHSHEHLQRKSNSFWGSFVFGISATVSWLPCLVAFLSAALLEAGTANHFLTGMVYMAVFALGFGLPFFLTSFLFERVGGVVRFIERHKTTINTVAGVFLIVMGILMMTGGIELIEGLFGHHH